MHMSQQSVNEDETHRLETWGNLQSSRAKLPQLARRFRVKLMQTELSDECATLLHQMPPTMSTQSLSETNCRDPMTYSYAEQLCCVTERRQATQNQDWHLLTLCEAMPCRLCSTSTCCNIRSTSNIYMQPVQHQNTLIWHIVLMWHCHPSLWETVHIAVAD